MPVDPAFADLPDANAAFADLPTQDQTGGGGVRSVFGMIPGGKYIPELALGAAQTVGALGQAVAHMGGDNQLTAPFISRLTGGMTPSQAADAANQKILDLYNQYFGSSVPAGGSVAKGIGQAGVLAPVLPAGILPGAVGAAAEGAGAGAIGGALTPVYGPAAQSNFWGEKAKQAGSGAFLGGALGGVLGGVGGLISGANVGPNQRLLADEGVRMLPGQALGGMWKSFEDKLSSLIPFIGPRSADSISDMNRAMYTRAVTPSAEFDPAGAQAAVNAPVGYKGVEKVGDFLSGQYNDALDRSSPIPADDLLSSLDNLTRLVPNAKRQDFSDLIQNEIASKVTPGGTLTPSVAKQADSTLGQTARTYRTSSLADDKVYSQAVRQAQSEIRGAFADANPDTAPQIRAADQGWQTLVQIENAAGMVGAKDGIFSPSQLRNTILTKSSLTRTQKATGDAPNLDLANAADAVLSNKIPDSGTPARAIAAMALGEGLGYLHGSPLGTGALVTAGIGSLPYLPGVSPLITKALTIQRPQALISLGDLTRASAPYLAPAAVGAMTPSTSQ